MVSKVRIRNTSQRTSRRMKVLAVVPGYNPGEVVNRINTGVTGKQVG